MKILIANDCGQSAHYWQRLGLARAFSSVGNEVVMWDTSKKSAYDSFDEFEPDLFIGQTYNVTPALIKCIKQRPLIKVALKASDYGYLNSKTDPNSPIVRVTEEERKLVDELRFEIFDNLVLFIHYHPDYLNYTHNGWAAEGYRIEASMNAADLFDYYNGEVREEYKCDIGFCGGYWPYKSQTLNKYILPLCSSFKYKVKIFGNGHWPVPQYHGFIQTEDLKYLFKSAVISPNVHEPHSQEFGYDIVERPFKILSSGGFCISDHVEGLTKLFPEGIVFGYDSKDFVEKVEYYTSVEAKSERDRIAQAGRKITLDKHTYFDRAADILKWYNLDYNNILEVKNAFVDNGS
jgi:hypothetical protein